MHVAEQKAQGIANAAVGIRHALQDLIGDAHFVRIVRGGNPQPHDIGAQRARELLRHERVADGLRHLAAFLIDRESMREHAAVRRAAMHCDGGQERLWNQPRC